VLWLVAQALGGDIDLDPTADDALSVPAFNHLTANNDCLEYPWTQLLSVHQSTVFINPPFDAPHLYLERLVNYRCMIEGAIALLKVGTLANKKTGALIREGASAVCVWGAGKVGRMAFIDHEGYQVSGADFDTCLVYFGNDPSLFLEVFTDWGLCMRIDR
jgi:hypothetical protein